MSVIRTCTVGIHGLYHRTFSLLNLDNTATRGSVSISRETINGCLTLDLPVHLSPLAIPPSDRISASALMSLKQCVICCAPVSSTKIGAFWLPYNRQANNEASKHTHACPHRHVHTDMDTCTPPPPPPHTPNKIRTDKQAKAKNSATANQHQNSNRKLVLVSVMTTRTRNNSTATGTESCNQPVRQYKGIWVGQTLQIHHLVKNHPHFLLISVPATATLPLPLHSHRHQ